VKKVERKNWRYLGCYGGERRVRGERREGEI